MTDFEKKLYMDMMAGHSEEHLMAEFKRCMAEAKREYDAEQKRIEEKRRADEEAKKKAEAKRLTGEAIKSDYVNGVVSAQDVAEIFNAYFHNGTKFVVKDAKKLEAYITAKDIEDIANLLCAADPSAVSRVYTWGNNVADTKKNKNQSQIDDDVIADFIGKLLH